MNILEPKVPLKPAERMILEEIVEDNTQDISYDMKFSNGRVEKREMTVVPKYNEIRRNSNNRMPLGYSVIPPFYFVFYQAIFLQSSQVFFQLTKRLI